ncbi:hypothetical protein [Streptosporangium canum]|uniref:hypothetical protein n=1 Tax=Streptosporangium canum TaxID=324952 RepID=UPI00379690F8
MNRPAEQAMGLVLAPRDEKYDEERAGCQTARRHRPDLVVGAVGPADAQAAVTYAGHRGLPPSPATTGSVTTTALTTSRRRVRSGAEADGAARPAGRGRRILVAARDSGYRRIP